MPGLRPDVDPDGLLEYSVVFTDRALNHMSQSFQGVMNDISSELRSVYGADGVAVVPGGGTYGMEAVARQFANDAKCLVIRNGFFSFRWSQILDMGKIAASTTVLKASRTDSGPKAPFSPPAIGDVVARIRDEKPSVVFAPHVETSAGMMLPDGYISEVTQAVRDSETDAGKVTEGDWIGLDRTGVIVARQNLGDAALDLLQTLIGDEHEIVTIIEGQDCPQEVTKDLLAWLSNDKPEIEVEVHSGGQPLYPYYFGIE